MTRFALSNNLSKGPTSVDIELSNRCNLRCKMCWFHGESGVGDRFRDSEMATEEIYELINQLAAYRPEIYFGGGEPFIREDFLPIMAHVKSFALPIAFTTNGTLLDEVKIQKVVELGVDHINFSIDGLEEAHDALRGRGSFAKALSNMTHLAEYKKRTNLEKPHITVNITTNPLTVGHLKEIIDGVEKVTGDAVNSFRIHHLWFITPTELQVHRATVNKALQISAHGASSHCIPLSQPNDPIALSNEISQLKDLERIVFFPDLQGKEIEEFYSEGYQARKRCMAPFRAVVVKPNGDVKFCPDEWIDDYVLGNIREDYFQSIWSNERARHFRSVVFREKSFPGCKRCSWMYCF
jgi:radical SAM protein with 4Fe4S-binding SPASM domain